MSRARVFMDISFDNNPPERLVIQLFAKPYEAVENFRALCAGDMGIGKTTGKPLHYKGCRFYRVFSGIIVEGGDFENQDGTGGESIYGGTFSDVNMTLSLTERGIVLMADHVRPNRLGSQFYICLSHHPPMDGFHVGVGKVIGGLEILDKFDHVFTSSLKPFLPIVITDCGEVCEDVNWEVTSEKPSSSNPHQHSDDPCKFRKSESSISKSEIIELKQSVEELNFKLCKLVEDKKKKRSNRMEHWPVIAASTVAIVLVGVFFRQAK